MIIGLFTKKLRKENFFFSLMLPCLSVSYCSRTAFSRLLRRIDTNSCQAGSRVLHNYRKTIRCPRNVNKNWWRGRTPREAPIYFNHAGGDFDTKGAMPARRKPGNNPLTGVPFFFALPGFHPRIGFRAGSPHSREAVPLFDCSTMNLLTFRHE